jgi:hypothetical protein
LRVVGPRYSRINLVVASLSKKADIKKAPVPVDKLARIAGATVAYAHFAKDVSGVLIRKPGVDVSR